MPTKTEIISAVQLLGLTYRCLEPGSGGTSAAIEVLKPVLGGDNFPEYITVVYATEEDAKRKEDSSCSSSTGPT